MRTLRWLIAVPALLLGQVEVYEGELDGRPIVYRIHEGRALYQDDIDLGPAAKPSGQRNTSFFTGNLWPEGRIPYEIDPTFPASTLAQLQQAIATWNNYGTPIRLEPRAGETDYTRITRSPLTTGVCSSAVGRRGGMQPLTLEDGCTAPTIIHEIGHTIGMWHEQSRIDRNLHVTVLYENIAKNYAGNYSINDVSGQDLGAYEYGSSMQYRPFSFSVDGRQAIESVPPGIPMGEAPGMNWGDLEWVTRKYGAVPDRFTVTTNPPGLVAIVDGQEVVTPLRVEWEIGSRHTVAVPETQTFANLRYTLGKWSDGGAREHTITATPDVSVFTAQMIRRLPVIVGPSLGGTVNVSPASPDGFYPAYTQVTLTAVPEPGYKFFRWGSTGGFACGAATTSANPLVLPPRLSGYGCVPLFTQQTMTTVTSDPPGRFVQVDGVTYASPANFLFAAGTSHTVNAVGVSSGFASRFLFSGWSDGGAQSHSYLATEEGETLTANYTKQYLLTLTQTPIFRIVASPAAVDGFYDAGTVVSLQPSLTSPLQLISWTGDLTGRSDPATVIMDDQRMVGMSLSSALPSFIVLNALTFRAAQVSPGQLISIFGTDLGPAGGVGPTIDSSGRIATSAGGTRVLFDGVPGPILYASATQVNTVVPYSLAGTSTRIAPEYQGVAKPFSIVPVTPVNPSIVSNGAGRAVVVNQDGSINGPDRPAKRGSVIIFYASGEGATAPAGIDGRVGAAPLARPVREASVRIGGRVAELLYAGNAPGFVAGAMQVNARIPEDAPAGEVSLYLVVGTTASPPGTMIYVE